MEWARLDMAAVHLYGYTEKDDPRVLVEVVGEAAAMEATT
jgi:hypothetical protein